MRLAFFAGFGLACMLLCFPGCKPELESPECPVISATVERVDVTPPRPKITIDDPAQLTNLLSFFGDIMNETETDLASLWEAKYYIFFKTKNGTDIKVATSYDDEDWSSGKGDKSLKPGLSEFLDPLFKAGAPAAEKETIPVVDTTSARVGQEVHADVKEAPIREACESLLLAFQEDFSEGVASIHGMAKLMEHFDSQTEKLTKKYGREIVVKTIIDIAKSDDRLQYPVPRIILHKFMSEEEYEQFKRESKTQDKAVHTVVIQQFFDKVVSDISKLTREHATLQGFGKDTAQIGHWKSDRNNSWESRLNWGKYPDKPRIFIQIGPGSKVLPTPVYTYKLLFSYLDWGVNVAIDIDGDRTRNAVFEAVAQNLSVLFQHEDDTFFLDTVSERKRLTQIFDERKKRWQRNNC